MSAGTIVILTIFCLSMWPATSDESGKETNMNMAQSSDGAGHADKI
jgi:hypothetical protein